MRGQHLIGRVGVFMLTGALLQAAEFTPAEGLVTISDIRYWSAPDHTRIVVDATHQMSYKTLELQNPPRLVVDVEGAVTSISSRSIEVADPVIHRIRVSQFKPTTVRIVVDLVKQSQSNIFTLNKYQDKPDRLVIDLDRADLAEREKKERLIQRDKAGKIIVIDPGHGGEDVGAIGFRGTYEKNVVLSLAKKVKAYIDQRTGYKAFLTREGDYFIPLRKRVEIAREYGANLFISLHTDASFNRQTRGASVYCLSLKGASDEAAKLLAERENASDFFGGVSYANNRDLNTILIDLVQTQTINDSLRFGGMLLNKIAEGHTIKFRQPKQAGFAVLKATEIPSVLVETGFITNPEDEKLLKNESFQRTLAQAIASVSCTYVELLARRNGTTTRGRGALLEKEQVGLLQPQKAFWQKAKRDNPTVDELARLYNE